MKLNRRDFFVSSASLLFLLERKLYSESNNFSDLNDDKKRSILFDIVNEMDGRYVFPVPDTDEKIKRQALTVYEPPYVPEFGAERPHGQKHNGIDVYDGFGKDVIYFADGEVEEIGRNVNKFDHGNIIVVNHGIVRGYPLWSYYLHIGGINGIKEGDSVKMGETFAKIDCTGISPDNKKLYRLGSRDCKEVAHLHFQIRVGDMHVNPNYFFPEYSKDSLPKLKTYRLAIRANSLEESIFGFKGKQALGSF